MTDMMGQLRKRAHRSESGFTMLEVVITVAIIAILAAIVFVNVIDYQRSMLQLELDATAKEIYIAAQNHLITAQNQGLLDEYSDDPNTEKGNLGIKYPGGNTNTGETQFGMQEPGSNGIYYFIYSPSVRYNMYGTDASSRSKSLLELMLPFGSIDGPVRVGGSYVVRYQISDSEPKTAVVLDVLYSKDLDLRTVEDTLQGSYELLRPLMSPDKSDERRNFGTNRNVIGWYGDAERDGTVTLEAPTIKVINSDLLKVEVTNPQSNLSATENLRLVLVVEGVTSKAAMYFVLGTDPRTVDGLVGEPSPNEEAGETVSTTYPVVLDDITTIGKRFVQVQYQQRHVHTECISPAFLPGEDLKIYAWVTCVDKVSNVAKTAPRRTNSLFETGKSGSASYNASISSLRHLANLSAGYSGFELELLTGQSVLSGSNAGESSSESNSENEGNDGNGTGSAPGSEEVAAGTGGGSGTGSAPGSSETPSSSYTDEEIMFAQAIAGESIITINAIQTADMSWDSFKTGVQKAAPQIYKSNSTYGSESISDPNHYAPVVQAENHRIKYNGQGNEIKGIRISDSDSAGLFKSLLTGSEAKNLKLVNFNIESTGDSAGALAGTATDTSITNILAYNDVSGISNVTDDSAYAIKGKSNAGGLVGTMTDGSMSQSAAALYVESTDGASGGLIGLVESGATTLTNSYSGGHTHNGKFEPVKTGAPAANVMSANGAVGGLVGSWSGGEISYCYSTCSVQGVGDDASPVGGLVGYLPSVNITNSYTVGKVSLSNSTNKKKGVFVGSNSTFTGTGNSYSKLACGMSDEELESLEALLHPVEWDTTRYKAFADKSNTAHPYDSYLTTRYYQNKYPFKTIADLSGETGLPGHLYEHYGDWPEIETVVINRPNN